MEQLSNLNDTLESVNLKLDQTLKFMEDIVSIVLNYSTKVPLSLPSDVYLIFNLRENLKILYRHVGNCVSGIRFRLSKDVSRLKYLDNKLRSGGARLVNSIDFLKTLKRINEKNREWNKVIEELDSNILCNQNYTITVTSIMDSVESLTTNKDEYNFLTAANFINQKVLYNGDSINEVVEKILRISRERSKNEREDTFIAKLTDYLNREIFVDKFQTEIKLNEILEILKGSKDQLSHSSTSNFDLNETMEFDTDYDYFNLQEPTGLSQDQSQELKKTIRRTSRKNYKFRNKH